MNAAATTTTNLTKYVINYFQNLQMLGRKCKKKKKSMLNKEEQYHKNQ